MYCSSEIIYRRSDNFPYQKTKYFITLLDSIKVDTSDVQSGPALFPSSICLKISLMSMVRTGKNCQRHTLTLPGPISFFVRPRRQCSYFNVLLPGSCLSTVHSPSFPGIIRDVFTINVPTKGTYQSCVRQRTTKFLPFDFRFGSPCTDRDLKDHYFRETAIPWGNCLPCCLSQKALSCPRINFPLLRCVSLSSLSK